MEHLQGPGNQVIYTFIQGVHYFVAHCWDLTNRKLPKSLAIASTL